MGKVGLGHIMPFKCENIIKHVIRSYMPFKCENIIKHVIYHLGSCTVESKRWKANAEPSCLSTLREFTRPSTLLTRGPSHVVNTWPLPRG